MSVRQATAAGRLYPENAESIAGLLRHLHRKAPAKSKHPVNVLGGIVPHGAYQHAADEAVHFFKILQKQEQPCDTFVIVNPSHHELSDDVALDAHDIWETPLGKVPLDRELMEFMNIRRSTEAHQEEHAAEVIVPYLQYSLPHSFKIVPISMVKQNYKSARNLAEKIFKANQVLNRRIVLIASADFSQQVPPEVGFYNDNLVINRILNNSIRGLFDTINENKITVCGYGPIMTLMFYCRMVNPSYQVDILARGNSAMETDEELVEDYVSAVFYV
jgi:AmmeMemoRadiSam system protein B